MIRRTFPVLTALALVGAAAVTAGAPATAARTSAAQLAATPTPFALSASGYATRVVGNGVPAGSDRSAFQAIGCTNKAGLRRENHEAASNLGEFNIAAAQTVVATTKRGNTVASWGRNRIAKVVVGNATDAAGRLVLRGVVSKSRTWHDGNGFHASTRTDLGSVVLDPLVGPDQNLPVPTRGNPLRVPGVAVIALGDRDRTVKANGAQANADALRIRLIPSGTVAYIAHSRAQIGSGLANGIYSGLSYATRANLISGGVTSGPTPLIRMPCTGTKFEEASIASANIGVGNARNLNASQRGVVRNGNATAFERGSVGRVSLLGGRLVVKGVVGKANVTLVGNTARKNVKGTRTASVVFNGREISLSGRDSIRLGNNVARLQPRLVNRTKFGIEVTALRVTLTAERSEVNLGHAQVAIRPSGL